MAFVILIVFVIALIVFAIGALSTQNLRNISGKYWEERARFGALAGVNRAMTELTADETWNAGYTDEQLEGDPDVTYSVQVFNRMDQLGAFAPDNRTWVPEDAVWIHAVATLNNRRNSGVSSLVSLVGEQRPVFNHAIFVVQTLILDNSQTLAWHPLAMGDGDAWIGTQSTANNAVQVRNNSFVDGDVLTGVDPQGTANPFSLDGSSNIFGDHKASEETVVVTKFVSPVEENKIPPFGPGAPAEMTMTSAALPAGAQIHPSGTITAGFQTMTLDPNGGGLGEPYGPVNLDFNQELRLTSGGTYYIQGSIDLRDGARLTVDPSVDGSDPAVVYIDQQLVAHNGAQINWNSASDQPGEPRALQIYCTSRVTANDQEVHLQSTDRVSMLYGGEKSNVFMKDASMYGGIIARTVSCEDSRIFYDVRNRGVKMNGRGEMTILSTSLESSAEASAAVASDTTTNPGTPPPPAPPPATTAPPPAPPPGATNPPPPPPPPVPPPPPPAPPPSVP